MAFSSIAFASGAVFCFNTADGKFTGAEAILHHQGQRPRLRCRLLQVTKTRADRNDTERWASVPAVFHEALGNG
jgi:hypothetical protein